MCCGNLVSREFSLRMDWMQDCLPQESYLPLPTFRKESHIYSQLLTVRKDFFGIRRDGFFSLIKKYLYVNYY